MKAATARTGGLRVDCRTRKKPKRFVSRRPSAPRRQRNQFPHGLLTTSVKYVTKIDGISYASQNVFLVKNEFGLSVVLRSVP